ncbi:2-hydroxychromene-2-carboxylate isomerase [Undibacterium sp. TJN25]|uniref:2-hydroxychromene-2-carboxylate isomerase n=1 Tax=Undibacterium sp. TJN25 TaxID=3413056 RepID=UPI003BF025AD
MSVDYIFDYRSPFSYLANSQLSTLDTKVNFMPVDIIEVMKLVNNQPSTLCRSKAKYAGQDAMRWARHYGSSYAPNSALFLAIREGKVDGSLLSRAGLAAQKLGIFSKVHDALFSAVWAGTDQLATEEDRLQFLEKLGLQDSGLWQLADDASIKKEMAEQVQVSADRGVFGVPTFILQNEMFFGNDRLDFLRDRLTNSPELQEAV